MKIAKKRDKNIATLLVDFINQSPKVREGLTDVRVEETFRREMGEIINKYTSSINFKNGILTLRVVSAPLRNELRHSKHIVVKRMNEALGVEIIKEVKLI